MSLMGCRLLESSSENLLLLIHKKFNGFKIDVDEQEGEIDRYCQRLYVPKTNMPKIATQANESL